MDAIVFCGCVHKNSPSNNIDKNYKLGFLELYV